MLSQPTPGPGAYVDRECVLDACIGTVPGIDQDDILKFVDCTLTPGQPTFTGCVVNPYHMCIEVVYLPPYYCSGAYIDFSGMFPELKSCYAGFIPCEDPRFNVED